MFRLLTEDEKSRLTSEYRYRRFTVFFLSLVVLGIIAIILAIPTYSSVYFEEQNLLTQKEAVQELADELIEPEVLDRLTEASVRIERLAPHTNEIFMHELTRVVLEEMPEGVLVSGLLLRKADETISVAISGRAEDRNTLLEFSDNLRGTEVFSEIVLSESELIREVDLNFRFEAKGEM